MLPVNGDSIDPIGQGQPAQPAFEPQQVETPTIEAVKTIVQAAAPGVDFEASYNALLQEYNDTKQAYEVLKNDFAQLQAAASKHSNIIQHFANLVKEIF